MSEELMDGAENPSEASPDAGTTAGEGAEALTGSTLAADAAAESGAEGQAGQPADGTLAAGAEAQTQESEANKAQQAEKPQGAPEQYADFQIPEGMEVAPQVVDEFKGVAKELNLSQEQAQGLVGKFGPMLQARGVANIQRISKEWAEQTKADPEIGGEHFVRSMASVARLRDRFAYGPDGKIDPQIAEFLNSPMGNHPGALKLLARAGAAFGEASFPTGGAAQSKYTAHDFYEDAKR